MMCRNPPWTRGLPESVQHCSRSIESYKKEETISLSLWPTAGIWLGHEKLRAFLCKVTSSNVLWFERAFRTPHFLLLSVTQGWRCRTKGFCEIRPKNRTECSLLFLHCVLLPSVHGRPADSTDPFIEKYWSKLSHAFSCYLCCNKDCDATVKLNTPTAVSFGFLDRSRYFSF
jgi:hypothetical protein